MSETPSGRSSTTAGERRRAEGSHLLPLPPHGPGQFNGPLLGMDVAVLSQDGEFVRDAIGELAVLNAWPGMTHSFWQDDERYVKTYWSRWAVSGITATSPA